MQTEIQFKENLSKLRLLKDGWLDGEGKAPTVELLSWFETWFLNLKESHDLYGYPLIFPNCDWDGGLELGWYLPKFLPTLEISPDHQTACFHSMDPSSPNGYCEINVNLADPADTEWADKLKRILAIGNS